MSEPRRSTFDREDALAALVGDPLGARDVAARRIPDTEIDAILVSPPPGLTLGRLAELVTFLTNYMLAKESPGRFPDYRDPAGELIELQAINAELHGPECHCVTLGYPACLWHQNAIADAMWPGER